jgi:hypothetical protein
MRPINKCKPLGKHYITFDQLAEERGITPQTVRCAAKRYGMKWDRAPIIGPGRRHSAFTVTDAARFAAEWAKEHGQ